MNNLPIDVQEIVIQELLFCDDKPDADSFQLLHMTSRQLGRVASKLYYNWADHQHKKDEDSHYDWLNEWVNDEFLCVVYGRVECALKREFACKLRKIHEKRYNNVHLEYLLDPRHPDYVSDDDLQSEISFDDAKGSWEYEMDKWLREQSNEIMFDLIDMLYTTGELFCIDIVYTKWMQRAEEYVKSI